jgi:hypothetical protein
MLVIMLMVTASLLF